MILCAACVMAFSIEKAQQELSSLIIREVESVTRGEVHEMKDQRDNPSGCYTHVAVEVTGGNGEVTIKWERVRGLENLCKDKTDSTCSAFPCES